MHVQMMQKKKSCGSGSVSACGQVIYCITCLFFLFEKVARIACSGNVCVRFCIHVRGKNSCPIVSHQTPFYLNDDICVDCESTFHLSTKK
jgi:hypothetical protein